MELRHAKAINPSLHPNTSKVSINDPKFPLCYCFSLLISWRHYSYPSAVSEGGDAGGSLKFNNPKLLDSLGLESLEESFKDIHEQESAEKERQFLGVQNFFIISLPFSFRLLFLSSNLSFIHIPTHSFSHPRFATRFPPLRRNSDRRRGATSRFIRA